MRKNRFLTRLASGALVVAVAAGGGLLLGGVANAVVPPGTLGTLTITPTSGTDEQAPVARTSGGCSADATAYELQIAGPIDVPPAQQVFNPGFPITTTSSAGFSTTDPFDISFGLTFKDAATARGKTLIAGEYSLTANCLDDFSGEVKGTFTTSVIFSSPTAWQVAGPGATATSTALGVTPASPAAAGTVETLTATVTPSAAAGSVQFKDGANTIGSPVAVAGGTASATTTLASGTHSLTAVFTPTDTTAFSGSTSPAVSYVVNAPTGAKATKTTLRVFPNPAFQRLPVFLFANVAPSNAAGTVQFKDGNTNIGAPVRVSGGNAFLLTFDLKKGTHNLTAEFIPAKPAAFGPSKSNEVKLTVKSFFGFLS